MPQKLHLILKKIHWRNFVLFLNGTTIKEFFQGISNTLYVDNVFTCFSPTIIAALTPRLL